MCPVEAWYVKLLCESHHYKTNMVQAQDCVAVINMMLIAALTQNVKCILESVYSKDLLEEWESRNPGVHPENNGHLGWRLWFTGSAAEMMQMM